MQHVNASPLPPELLHAYQLHRFAANSNVTLVGTVVLAVGVILLMKGLEHCAAGLSCCLQLGTPHKRA